MLLRDAEVRLDELHCGYAAKADDYLRLKQSYLPLEPLGAGHLLRLQRVAVLGRAALHHVADVYLCAVEVDELEHVVKQLAAAADKGLALQILLLAGAFADEQYLGILRPDTEHDVMPRFAQSAAPAV